MNGPWALAKNILKKDQNVFEFADKKSVNEKRTARFDCRDIVHSVANAYFVIVICILSRALFRNRCGPQKQGG